ncbi:hypothetical protein [[Phormidium] sp. ETS-05]|uniref:hypothetical protein n=1 Tax=[Phormidium] sp. ETS-05 TaxID=222819 RepID=UPI0018EF0E85|nr:hypothetical protein [[Phormidium] sp. ETS-05]
MSLNFTIIVNYSSFGVAVAVAAFTQYNVPVKVPQLLQSRSLNFPKADRSTPPKPIAQLLDSRSLQLPKADRLFAPKKKPGFCYGNNS